MNLHMEVWIAQSFNPRLSQLKPQSQNCGQVGGSHDSNRDVGIDVMAFNIQVANDVVDICKDIPVVQTQHTKWTY